MRGQVSTELLIIVALILLVFIPLLVMVYFKSTEANEQIASYEAELAVFRLAYLANSVGSLGTNTTVYTDVYLPRNMESLEAWSVGQGGEIILRLETQEGPMEIVEVVYHSIGDEGVLVEKPSFGWTRLQITSVYESGEAEIFIRRA